MKITQPPVLLECLHRLRIKIRLAAQRSNDAPLQQGRNIFLCDGRFYRGVELFYAPIFE